MMRYFVSPKRTTAVIFAMLLLALVFSFAVQLPLFLPASNRFESHPIYKVNTDKPVIAMTFNAAWDDEDVPELLSILGSYNIKCTFFVLGEWAEKYPDSMLKIYNSGHEIQSHSYNHDSFTELSNDEIKQQIIESQKTIEKITKKRPDLVRVPSGAYDNRVIEVLNQLQIYTIQWSYDSIDWKETTVDQMLRKLEKTVSNGDIMLFHVGGINTLDALPILIDYLVKESYSFVTVSDLIYKNDYIIDNLGVQQKSEINNQ